MRSPTRCAILCAALALAGCQDDNRTAGFVSVDTGDSGDGDTGGGDATVDVAPDTTQEVGADTAPDVPADTPEDVDPDTPADVPADAPLDTPSDAPADTPVDTAPDSAPDSAPDTEPDTAPDTAPDTTPDTPDECVDDAAEDDDDIENNTELDDGVPVEGRVAVPGDDDFFSMFTLPGCHNIYLDLTYPAESGTLTLQIIDPAESVIDTAVGEDGFARAIYEPGGFGGGTFFGRVINDGAGTCVTYDIVWNCWLD